VITISKKRTYQAEYVTIHRFLIELSHDIGQDELVGVQVPRGLGETRVPVHLLEPVELPALRQPSNSALMTQVMKVQVDHPELRARLGREAVASPVVPPLGRVAMRLQHAGLPRFRSSGHLVANLFPAIVQWRLLAGWDDRLIRLSFQLAPEICLRI
jgi:hypothetical protein